jgi:hypothetical protein
VTHVAGCEPQEVGEGILAQSICLQDYCYSFRVGCEPVMFNELAVSHAQSCLTDSFAVKSKQ